MLAFASIFQIPMVGSDVCGFGGNTTEELCARWAMLGGFYPFYRNHNELGSIGQEFYRWPSVTEAAKKIIDIRYRLLDYLYTSFHKQSVTGTPFLQPLFYVYPDDEKTFGNEKQFFYGDSLLVSPVSGEGENSVQAYFPDGVFYDWFTGDVVEGGDVHTITDVAVTDIPIHVRGGSIIPLRVRSAKTTADLRKRGFEILVAPGGDGTASGELYLDDGESIEVDQAAEIRFEYAGGKLKILGKFGYHPDVVVEAVTLLGQKGKSRRDVEYDAKRQSVTKKVQIELTGPAEVTLS